MGTTRLVTGAVIASAAAAALVMSERSGSAAADAVADPFQVFCVPAPRAAMVAPSDASDRVIAVQVPPHDPAVPVLDASDASTTVVDRGAIIEFQVRSEREGALAVHGLSELVVLRSGSATVRFRAIHAGRFPLHFHGADQSHFEIAVLEIRS